MFERDSANGGDFGERRDRTGAYFASNATSCRASYLAGRARSTAGIAAGIVSAGMFVGIAAGVAAHVAAAVAASGGETARAMAAYSCASMLLRAAALPARVRVWGQVRVGVRIRVRLRLRGMLFRAVA